MAQMIPQLRPRKSTETCTTKEVKSTEKCTVKEIKSTDLHSIDKILHFNLLEWKKIVDGDSILLHHWNKVMKNYDEKSIDHYINTNDNAVLMAIQNVMIARILTAENFSKLFVNGWSNERASHVWRTRGIAFPKTPCH